MDRGASRISNWAFGVGAVALVAAMAVRLWLGRGLPLWLDESWTGMIATQPSWASFWREAWLDCNPPLYYALMALWTGALGASDIALRLPSLICVVLAAMLPLLWRVPGLNRARALCFALLMILWQPGFEISLDARGYGLLMLLSVGQLLAFVRLMSAPGHRAALIWASLASLAALTHYHALLVSGLQGLALLYVHRARAVQLWPAAFAFLPAFGWLAIHAPRLADYARPDVAWYEPMTLNLAGKFAAYPLGGAGLHLVLLAAVLLVSVRGQTAATDADPSPQARMALHWAVVASVAGLAVELMLEALRPMLTDRYLVPLVPGILLGLIVVAARGRHARLSMIALPLVFALALNPVALRTKLIEKTRYNFAAASDFVAHSGARYVVFTWDHPAARILDHGSLAKLGGFFFARQGHALPVEAIVLLPGRDGNALLQRAAGPGAGVIWIYNRARMSAARHRPPVPMLWHGRDCRLMRGVWIGTLACGPQRN